MTTATETKAPTPSPVPNIEPRIFESYERSFHDSCGGCVRRCACGMTFFNSDGGWDWEDGELEELRKWQARGEARDLSWSVGGISVNGRDYVIDCDCWHDSAKRVIGFLLNHAEEIAEFFRLEAKRRTVEASDFASVVAPPTVPPTVPPNRIVTGSE